MLMAAHFIFTEYILGRHLKVCDDCNLTYRTDIDVTVISKRWTCYLLSVWTRVKQEVLPNPHHFTT